MDLLVTVGESALIAGVVIGFGVLKARLIQAAEDRHDRKADAAVSRH